MLVKYKNTNMRRSIPWPLPSSPCRPNGESCPSPGWMRPSWIRPLAKLHGTLLEQRNVVCESHCTLGYCDYYLLGVDVDVGVVDESLLLSRVPHAPDSLFWRALDRVVRTIYRYVAPPSPGTIFLNSFLVLHDTISLGMLLAVGSIFTSI